MGALIAAVPAAFAAVGAGTATAAETAIVLTTVATAASAAGAGYTAYGSAKQSQFQSAVAKNNAVIAENNAKTVLMEGQVLESAKRAETGRKIGGALAEQGASGVDVSFGTPALVRQGLYEEGELDALTIRHNAMAKALGYNFEGANARTSAKLAKQAAGQALIAGGINVGSSFLSGASSMANTNALVQTGQLASSSVPKGK